MKRLKAVSCALAALCVLSAATVPAVAPPDWSKIDRQIAKQPAYNADQPLYGLYVFGPQAKTKAWAVLDKSDKSKSDFDVLYFDRNADGDLTDADERIEGEKKVSGTLYALLCEAPRRPFREKVPDTFFSPVTGDVHTDLKISRRGDTLSAGTMFLTMNYKGKHLVRGGYAPESGPYCRFASSPEKAPILCPGAEGTFSFQRWIWKELKIGAAGDVSVFMGHRGRGENTFCAVTQEFLPEDVPVLATLVYSDTGGKERRVQAKLRERC